MSFSLLLTYILQLNQGQKQTAVSPVAAYTYVLVVRVSPAFSK